MLLERLSVFGASAKGRAPRASALDAEVLPADGCILLSVPLPKLPPSQRRKAARYAVEDQLVEDLEIEQVAVGPEFPVGSGRWLVMVLPKDRTQQFFKGKRPVLSDLMKVKVPEVGWAAVDAENGVLVRGSDGSGTMLPKSVFEVWSADKKGTISVGDLLQGGEFVATGGSRGVFDLRRNVGEDIAYMFERGLLWSMGPLFACLAVLSGIEAYETSRTETYRDNQLFELNKQLEAVGVSGSNPVAAASALIADAASREESNAVLQSLLGAMSQVPFEALNISVRSISFRKTEAALVLRLGGPNLQGLQDVENLFEGSVARATLGASELRDGIAIADLVLTLRGQQ